MLIIEPFKNEILYQITKLFEKTIFS